MTDYICHLHSYVQMFWILLVVSFVNVCINVFVSVVIIHESVDISS